jgi:glycosyltransferase involved in cell wall biosynthesis
LCFFQNKENQQFFINNNIAVNKARLVPGSGVNLDHFYVLDYPSDDTTEFVFISRIMKEKGIEQYLEAAEYIKSIYPNTHFHICGFCEEDYYNRLEEKSQTTEKALLIRFFLIYLTRIFMPKNRIESGVLTLPISISKMGRCATIVRSLICMTVRLLQR